MSVCVERVHYEVLRGEHVVRVHRSRARCRRTAYRPVHANARTPACAPSPPPMHFAIFHFHRSRSLIPAVARSPGRSVGRRRRSERHDFVTAVKFLSPFSPMTSSGKGHSHYFHCCELGCL